MTALPRGGGLRIDGDLSLEVDGTPVRVHAAGDEIQVVAGDVRTLLARAREASRGSGPRPGRRELARLAGELAARGVRLRLETGSRPVLTVGAGVDSRAGSLLLGTRRAAPASAAALTATDQGRRVLAGAGLALAAVALLAVRRRG